MPNKLIGQRFQINDRVSRKNYSVIANTYKKKYGNITETIERKNAARSMGYTPYLKNKNIDNTR